MTSTALGRGLEMITRDYEHDEPVGGRGVGAGLSGWAEQLIASARAQGVELTGPGGLLTGLTKRVLETALDVELTEHLGHERHERSGSGNLRNGSTDKTVRTDVGDVRITVPRDRAGSFSPAVMPKHPRRLAGFDDAVLSLYAKGIGTGDIANHLADVYGSQSREAGHGPRTPGLVRRPGQDRTRCPRLRHWPGCCPPGDDTATIGQRVVQETAQRTVNHINRHTDARHPNADQLAPSRARTYSSSNFMDTTMAELADKISERINPDQNELVRGLLWQVKDSNLRSMTRRIYRWQIHPVGARDMGLHRYQRHHFGR